MVKHVVLFKLRDKTQMSTLKEILDTMKGKIPAIKEMEVGLNLTEREISFDVCLIVQVGSPKEVIAYLEHPYHKEVVAKIDPMCERYCSVDYLPMP